MKNSVLGCCGVILGIILGAIIMVFALPFVNLNALAREPVTQEQLLPNRADVTITASNSFINPQLEQAIVKSGLAKQAHVSLVAPNLIRVASPVNISFLGQLITVDATVQMAVGVQGGRITLTTDKVEASGFGVPPSALGQDFERQRTAAEDEINREAQQTLEGTRLVISDVRVAPAGLSVDLKMQ